MDMFEQLEESKRCRLRELGWRQSREKLRGIALWFDPQNKPVKEPDAFRWLEEVDNG